MDDDITIDKCNRRAFSTTIGNKKVPRLTINFDSIYAFYNFVNI